MTSKTIAVFTTHEILNTEANQKLILQALHEGIYFKDLEDQFIILDITLIDHNDQTAKNVEVRVTSLSNLSKLWCNADLDENPLNDYLYFINFKQIVDFNLGEI